MPILPCGVCSHISNERLESDLARGVEQTVVAARYGVSAEVLARHVDVCLGPPSAESLLADAVLIKRNAIRILNQAVSDADVKSALGAMTAADRSVTTLCKMLGLFQDGPAIDARQQHISLVLGDLSLSDLRALSANLRESA